MKKKLKIYNFKAIQTYIEGGHLREQFAQKDVIKSLKNISCLLPLL